MPISPLQKEFFLTPLPTPLESPISLHTFRHIFWSHRTSPLHPQGIPVPFVRGVWIFSGTAHWNLEVLFFR